MAQPTKMALTSEGHAQLLLDTLCNLYQSQQLTDVTLVTEGKEFKVHMVVLGAYSTYFHGLVQPSAGNYPLKHHVGKLFSFVNIKY